MVNAANQRLTILRTFVDSHGLSTMLEESLFAFPSELDLHATAAGLRLETRRGGWGASGIDDSLTSNIVSVYRKPLQ